MPCCSACCAASQRSTPACCRWAGAAGRRVDVQGCRAAQLAACLWGLAKAAQTFLVAVPLALKLPGLPLHSHTATPVVPAPGLPLCPTGARLCGAGGLPGGGKGGAAARVPAQAAQVLLLLRVDAQAHQRAGVWAVAENRGGSLFGGGASLGSCGWRRPATVLLQPNSAGGPAASKLLTCPALGQPSIPCTSTPSARALPSPPHPTPLQCSVVHSTPGVGHFN